MKCFLRRFRSGAWRWAAVLALAGCWEAPSAFARLPLAGCVYYGQARDEYGRPYTTNAEVVLRLNGREVTRRKIRPLAPGVNFRLTLPLDDGTGERYAAHAARPGDTVEIVLWADGGERLLARADALAAVEPGKLIPVYVTAGSDTDGDGLPDAWEWELVRNSRGRLHDPADVRPEDDFDGDGVSNGDEYRAGTLAFLAEDVLSVEQMTWQADGRVRLRFLTAPGITYEVEAATAVGADADWRPVPFAFAAGAEPRQQALLGDGFYVDVYVPASETIRFFRLSAR